MHRIHLAELRDASAAWAGVSIAFVAVNAALAMTLTILYSGSVRLAAGELPLMAATAYTIVQGLNALVIRFVAVPIVAGATSLVVDSRRGALARLALSGATPAQVRGTVTSQLVAVSLVSAVVGDAVGLALVAPMLRLVDYSARAEPLHVSIDPLYSLLPLIAGSLLCVLVAVIGGGKQARLASEIPPVEALRQSLAPTRSGRLTTGGWIRLVLLALLVAGLFASVPLQVAHRYKETVSNLLILGFFQIVIWGALLAVVAPWVIQPLTSAWTRWVPSRAPVWLLARATVAARVERLYKSVVPVMFTIGIAVASVGLGASMVDTLAASMADVRLEGSSWESLVMMFGAPLSIALAGGVGALTMMGSQRSADLALAGVVGATPAQRTLIPLLEAVIITGSAALLSLGMVVPAYAFQAWSLTAAGLTYRLNVPVVVGAVAVAICLVVTIAATVLPTLRSQRSPEPRVIMRLVAA
ncbi:FtsX-like permease family protein [Propioniciclava soli]|uniref:FtsX-like permease family protein n=2 Tax=Propioniciclava soli TaxID=2775081 RepID=A0ABZ3C505_9ACTN